MHTGNINQAKTRTNERHDETSERGKESVRYVPNLKPDDFRAKYEHDGGSGLIGFLQILLAKATQTTRAVLGACAASDTRDMPEDIATQMAGILALAE